MDDTGRGGWVRKTIARGEADAAEAARPVEAGSPGFGAFIGEGAEFVGTLKLSGSFRIDCEFSGAIVSDGRVIVGEAADIRADIRAREVVILGAVSGDVWASRLLSIGAQGRLQGGIETPCLEVEKGGVFNGTTRMLRPEVQARAGASAPRPDARPPAATSPSATSSS